MKLTKSFTNYPCYDVVLRLPKELSAYNIHVAFSYNLRNANGKRFAPRNGWGNATQSSPKWFNIMILIFSEILKNVSFHQLERFVKEALPGYDYIGVGVMTVQNSRRTFRDFISYRQVRYYSGKAIFGCRKLRMCRAKVRMRCLRVIAVGGHFQMQRYRFEFSFFFIQFTHSEPYRAKRRGCKCVSVQEKNERVGKGKNLPAILTGDFNVTRLTSHTSFVEKGVLCDSYEKWRFRYATTELHRFRPIMFYKVVSTMCSYLRLFM